MIYNFVEQILSKFWLLCLAGFHGQIPLSICWESGLFLVFYTLFELFPSPSIYRSQSWLGCENVASGTSSETRHHILLKYRIF